MDQSQFVAELAMLSCVMMIGCDNKPTPPQVTMQYVPAPTPTSISEPAPIVQADPCKAIFEKESDKSCDENNKDDKCVFTTDDTGRCIILKKKPTQKELNKLRAEARAETDLLEKKMAEEKKMCSGKNIMNTCCERACSGEQSIQI